jgi:RNA polymerase sigma-70 factor (ECF subfamily)
MHDEAELLAALRGGDEQAFAGLIDRYHASMLRVARSYVATREAAEDVVQETWLGVIKGLDGFEGRSSLKTWIFRILVNRARSRGQHEARSQPFSTVGGGGDDSDADRTRFHQGGRWAGFWSAPPTLHSPCEQEVIASEAGEQLLAAIGQLPDSQRVVITLRDVQGLSAAEVCELLDISEANQRVLLHRARTKARAALERYLDSPDHVQVRA